MRRYWIVFLFIIAIFSCHKETTEYAPDFTLPDLNGNKISLSDFRGKVVILEFFTTKCPTCRLMIPNLNEIYRKYKDKKVILLSISLDNLLSIEQIYKFVRDTKINYPVLIGNEEIVFKYRGISLLPHLVIIDQQGRVYKTHQGPFDKKELQKEIMKLL